MIENEMSTKEIYAHDRTNAFRHSYVIIGVKAGLEGIESARRPWWLVSSRSNGLSQSRAGDVPVISIHSAKILNLGRQRDKCVQSKFIDSNPEENESRLEGKRAFRP